MARSLPPRRPAPQPRKPSLGGHQNRVVTVLGTGDPGTESFDSDAFDADAFDADAFAGVA